MALCEGVAKAIIRGEMVAVGVAGWCTCRSIAPSNGASYRVVGSWFTASSDAQNHFDYHAKGGIFRLAVCSLSACGYVSWGDCLGGRR